MEKYRETLKSKGTEFVIVVVLFGGLLYAVTTAYKTSGENSRLERQLESQKIYVENRIGEYKNSMSEALARQDTSVRQIKQALFVILSEMKVPADAMKNLISMNRNQVKSLLAKTVAGDPNAIWAHAELAQMSIQDAEYTEAFGHVAAISQSKNSINGLGWTDILGSAASLENREEIARELEKAALDMYSENAGAMFVIATINQSIGKDKESAEFLNRAIEIDPNYEPAKAWLERIEKK